MNDSPQSPDQADPAGPATLNPELVPSPPVPAASWQERGEQHRAEEWQMSQRLLSAARILLRKYLLRHDVKSSLADISSMLEVASKLGRLATGLATGKTEISGHDGGPLRVEFRAMLDKVYGQPLPGEINPVETQALPAATPASDGTSQVPHPVNPLPQNSQTTNP